MSRERKIVYLHRPEFSAGNPVLSGLLVVLGVIVLTAALLLGLVVVAIFAVSLLIAGAVVGLRLWWLRRKLRDGRDGAAENGRIIEGDFRVIDDEKRHRHHG